MGVGYGFSKPDLSAIRRSPVYPVCTVSLPAEIGVAMLCHCGPECLQSPQYLTVAAVLGGTGDTLLTACLELEGLL